MKLESFSDQSIQQNTGIYSSKRVGQIVIDCSRAHFLVFRPVSVFLLSILIFFVKGGRGGRLWDWTTISRRSGELLGSFLKQKHQPPQLHLSFLPPQPLLRLFYFQRGHQLHQRLLFLKNFEFRKSKNPLHKKK